MDPPEIERQDGHCSDDLFSGPTEMFEEPVEVERPVETKKIVETEKPITADTHTETDGCDSVDDLLGSSFDKSVLMDLGQDYASDSGSDRTEDRGSEGMFDPETIIPVSPIYRRDTKGLVGSGVDTGFYDSFEGSSGDEEAEPKDGVESDEAADIGVGAAEASEGVAVSEAAAADAAAAVAASVGVAAEVPVLGNDNDLTVSNGTTAPVEQLVSVASILARDGDGGGSGTANADGGAAVGQGMGPPEPDLQALYGVVPQLLVAPNMDLFNRLLVGFGPVCRSHF